jgi:hypothetical protein
MSSEILAVPILLRRCRIRVMPTRLLGMQVAVLLAVVSALVGAYFR